MRSSEKTARLGAQASSDVGILRAARDDVAGHQRRDGQQVQVASAVCEGIGDVALRDHAVDRLTIVADDRGADPFPLEMTRQGSDRLRGLDGQAAGSLHFKNVSNLHRMASGLASLELGASIWACLPVVGEARPGPEAGKPGMPDWSGRHFCHRDRGV